MSADAADTRTADTRTAAKNDPATLEWMLPLLVAAGAFITLAKLLAGPLALPLISLLTLGTGFGLATALLLAGSRFAQNRSSTAWTIAGALVLLGFAAALLSDGPEALTQIERMQTHGIASAGH